MKRINRQNVYAELGIMAANTVSTNFASHLNIYIVGRLGYNYTQNHFGGDGESGTSSSGDVNIIELLIPLASINNA